MKASETKSEYFDFEACLCLVQELVILYCVRILCIQIITCIKMEKR